MSRKSLLRVCLTACASVSCVGLSSVGGMSAARAQVTATPTLSRPPANTGHAFNASSYQRVPYDLASAGYTESEYFLTGTADVYQYASQLSDTPSVLGGPLPYVNRILVRAPSNPAKFSGNVIVEIVNDALVTDNPSIWPLARPQFVGNGDAWIGITSQPQAVAALKKYSASRYASLSWPALAATTSCASSATAENGIIYDEITQIGTLLKQPGNPNNPLAGYNVKATYLTGYSAAASILLTYDRVFGIRSPLYDAYVVAAGGYRAPLNGCESTLQLALRAGAPTSTVSPVFQTQTISETLDSYQEIGMSVPLAADSDSATNRYRYYDVAGSAHVNGTLYNAQPQTSDINAAGGITFTTSQLQTYCGDPAAATLTAFPDHYAYDAIWAAVENQVRNGVTPPHAPHMTLSNYSGYPVGGWRTPSVDVPIASYYPGTIISSSYPQIRNLCALTGYQEALPAATASALYPTPALYARKVAADARNLQAGAYLTPSDAASLIANPSAP